MKRKNNVMYKAGVLLIAAVMILSIMPAITADTGENDDIKTRFLAEDNPYQSMYKEIEIDGTPSLYVEGKLEYNDNSII